MRRRGLSLLATVASAANAPATRWRRSAAFSGLRSKALPLSVLVCAAFASGCAPALGDAYERAFDEAERAQHAGRSEEAAAAYANAARVSVRVKDRDEALFLEARAFVHAGRFDAASRTFEELARVSPKGPRGARAAFDRATIEIEHGDAERGYAMLEAAARAHPEHGLARPAIQALAQHAEDRGGPRAAIAWLEHESPAFRATEQDEAIRYTIAAELAKAGDAAGAHDAFLGTARAHPYPFGGFTDDALLHAAEIDVARGRGDEAIAHLREMLASRESSDTMGSYERPRYAQAQMKIGEIYRDLLHDDAAARRVFHELYVAFPTSILRDDALWAEARLAQKDGDAPASCSVLRTLVRDLPDSRYVACANLICPDAPAPSKANRPCADYIRRSLEETAGLRR